MPAHPQIHQRHDLPGVLRLREPHRLQTLPDQLLQLHRRQDALRHIRPHHARPYTRANHRLGVIQQEQETCLFEIEAERVAHRAPDGRHVPIHRDRLVLLGDSSDLEIVRKGTDGGGGVEVLVWVLLGAGGSEGFLPDGQEGPALGDAGAARDGARGAGVEVVVELHETKRVAEGGKDVRDLGVGDGLDREGEEFVLEEGESGGGGALGGGGGGGGGLVVDEEGFEAAAVGEASDGKSAIGEEEHVG